MDKLLEIMPIILLAIVQLIQNRSITNLNNRMNNTEALYTILAKAIEEGNHGTKR